MMSFLNFTLFLFLLNTVQIKSNYCDVEKYFLIRNAASAGVLQASGTSVTVQLYTGDTSQLWKFESGNKPGTFYLANNQFPVVLDVVPSTVNPAVTTVYVSTKGNSLYQEWYINSNGTIVNSMLDQRLYLSYGEIGQNLGTESASGVIHPEYAVFFVQEQIDKTEKL